MSRVLRVVLAAVAVIASASFMAEAVGQGVQAPTQGPRAGAPVRAAEAAPFAGDWAVTVGMNAFEATFAVSVKADAGKVTATVRSEGQPTTDVSDLSLSGRNLVLKYLATMGNNPIPAVLTLLDSQQWKLSASHSADNAATAASLRGWSSGVPQAPGMWFTIELPQAAAVTEVQFESAVSAGSGGRGRAGGQASGRGGAGPAPPSTDGTTWSTPVAEGKGGGPRTIISFAPVRAKFVRLTQTDAAPDAPAWSIRNLRIYEAPASTTKK
jgi:hypothetical protein